MQSKITIAIQRKGRLYENSKNLLIKSGINFSANGERLLARSSNMDIDILLAILKCIIAESKLLVANSI